MKRFLQWLGAAVFVAVVVWAAYFGERTEREQEAKAQALADQTPVVDHCDRALRLELCLASTISAEAGAVCSMHARLRSYRARADVRPECRGDH